MFTARIRRRKHGIARGGGRHALVAAEYVATVERVVERRGRHAGEDVRRATEAAPTGASTTVSRPKSP